MSFIFYLSIKNKGMAQSTAVGKSGNSEIKVKSTIEFFRTTFNSFRAQVCLMNGLPYVGLVKFWKPENSEFFVPTKKGIFLSLEQWRALGGAAEGINQMLSTFLKDGLGIYLQS